MNKELTKKMALTAVITSLAIVLSTWFKVPLISDIKLDLSYVALTVAIIYCDTWGAVFVGGMTALLGSLLFSSYGLSYSWIMANITIALIGSLVYKKTKSIKLLAVALIIGCFLGMMVVKTGIECVLYQIPLAVKIPKSLVAFASDTVCLLIGLLAAKKLNK